MKAAPTNTRKQPASRLPWRLKGKADHGYIIGPDGHVDEIPFEAWGEDAKRLRKDWQYLLHAGNAYPKLVAALHWYAQTPDGGGVAKDVLRHINELPKAPK